MQSGRILPGRLTVELLAAEVERVSREQRGINPFLTPVYLVDGFPRSLDNIEHFTERVRCLTPPQLHLGSA